jgi:hypothetical protein
VQTEQTDGADLFNFLLSQYYLLFIKSKEQEPGIVSTAEMLLTEASSEAERDNNPSYL